MADADEDALSPLTAGLAKRALAEMRAVLTAARMREPFFDLFEEAGLGGIVAAIEHDAANLEDIATNVDDVGGDADKAIKKIVKLLEDAGKRLDPVQSVPGSNATERWKQVHRVYCLFNRHLAEARSRATAHALKLAADELDGSSDEEAGSGKKAKKAKKAKRAKKAVGDSSDDSDSSEESSEGRSRRKRTKAQLERRSEARDTRRLHAVYEALCGFSEGTAMMTARVPYAKSRRASSDALEDARPGLARLADTSPEYESTVLPMDEVSTEHGLVVSLLHVRCILDHLALTHAVDLSRARFTHVRPRPCDRVDLEVIYKRPGKEDKKVVVRDVGVRPDRLDRLEFTLWAAVVEHRVSARALAAMWARIYKRIDQLMQQQSSTVTHAIDLVLSEADLFRPVPAAGTGGGGAAGSSSRSGASGRGSGAGRAQGETRPCHDFQRGKCERGESCRFVHVPSALRGGREAAGDDARRRADREEPRSRSASRGRSPSNSPSRSGNGRSRGSASTPGGASGRRGGRGVGFFS
jgi:hypothetical protein